MTVHTTTTLQLRDYQVMAALFLQKNPRAALFLDMGLGKTAATLSALTPDHLPALVVAPKRVAETVWPAEQQLWRPDLRLALAAGSPKQREKALTTTADIHVIGRDNLHNALDHASTRQWRTLIIDELSGFKNKRSQRWRAANRLANHPRYGVPHVWGLTGTPAPNGHMDLWAQVALLDKGERLGRTLTVFRERFFRPGRRLPNGIIASWELTPGSDEKIDLLIQDICLSMGTEGRITLPPVTHNAVDFVLPASAMKAYRDMEKELVADLRIIGGEIHTAANAAALSTKLSQVTAGFIFSDDRDLGAPITRLHDLRVQAVQEICDGTGSPVLVFYRYRPEKEALLKAIKGARSIEEPGVIDDWNAGRVPVLVTHPESAGHGLNLQHGGHTIVWSSLTWSQEQWSQANKRLARPGQKHPVVIHRIEARTPKGGRTIDHRIYDRVTGKTTVQQAILDAVEAPLL